MVHFRKMSTINSLVNVCLADQREIFLLCNYEPEKILNIYLINVNDCQAFYGHATDLDLRSQAAKIKTIFKEFISLTTKALTKNEGEGSNFLYSLEKNCENFTFAWKSIDSEETIITIGSMKVSQTDYGSVIKDVFLKLSTELSNLNSKVLVMEKELANAKDEEEKAVRLVSDTKDMKERMEKELYSKFILVLNEKKRKIKELNFENSSKSVRKSKKTALSRKMHAISESSSDEAVTDNENMDVAVPSNSKSKNSSMFFDDDEPSLLPSPSKKRNRHQKTVAESIQFQERKSKEKLPDPVRSESDDDLFNDL